MRLFGRNFGRFFQRTEEVASTETFERLVRDLIAIGVDRYDAAILAERAELLPIDAVALLRQDPYRLCQGELNLSFTTADRVARQLGVELTDPRRVASLAEYSLSRLIARTGDTVGSAEAIAASARDAFPGFAQAIARINDPRVVCVAPGLFTTAQQAQQDAETASFLVELARDRLRVDDLETRIAKAERSAGFTLNHDQRQAVRLMLTRRVSILTGGPGTGKTTTLAVLIKAIGTHVTLAAPTGRAAQRMTEQTGISASTLHRLLGDHLVTTPDKAGEAPINYASTLIVDEMSMVDSAMMAAVARALPGNARLILVGDPDQLPSIGAGAVLRDLIATEAVTLCRLTKIQRQAEGSSIIANARAINRGEIRLRTDRAFTFIATASDAESAHPAAAVASACDPAEVRILSAIKRGEAGVHNLNALMQTRRLGPVKTDEPTLRCRGQEWTWRVGDPVLHTRNDYTLDLVNGEAGQVVGIDQELEEIAVAYPNRAAPVIYQLNPGICIIPAYAMTIHKSQGSEYGTIVLTLPQQPSSFISRMMVYTAITRAKGRVVVVGARAALDAAIINDQPAQRRTGLPAFLAAAARIERKLAA